MFTDPTANLENFGIEPGMKIADLGSGSGFYSIPAAKMAGDTGVVYAVDVQKNLLEKVKSEADREHVSNIEYIWGDIETHNGTKIADNTVGAVFLSNILFQLEDKEGAIAEAKRILVSGGRILCVDWTDSFGGLGPDQQAVFPANDAKELLEKHDLEFQKEFDPGAHHYALVYRKK
jgi:ubiquinone/menaquinone biosynthesis C-methylase UbiE